MTPNEIKAQEIIYTEVENAIKLLENHCQKFCDNQGQSAVPMNHIRTMVRLLLEGYRKGIDSSRTPEEETPKAE
jgi:hypothetical protein